MTKTEYRYALCLLDAALALFAPCGEPLAGRRRRLRVIWVEFELLRAGLRQPAANLQRN